MGSTPFHPSTLLLTGALSLLGSTVHARPLSEKVTERVVTIGVDEALAALERQENQQRIGNIVSSAPLRDGMRKLSASIVAGAVDGLVESTARKGIALDGKQTRTLLEKHIAPAAETLTRRMVDGALTAALSEEHAKRAERFGELATRGVLRGIADGIEQDVGPALARTITRDIAPAVGGMLRNEVVPSIGVGLGSDPMQRAVGLTTASIASNVVHGADHAIDEVQAESGATDQRSGLALFGDRVAIGYAVAVVVATALAVLLIVMAVFLVRSARRQRELEQQGKTRERVLVELLEQRGCDHDSIAER